MNIAMSHPQAAYEHADKAVRHYEKLIAGDGITRADLVVFGAQLREALRQRDAAERILQEEDHAKA